MNKKNIDPIGVIKKHPLYKEVSEEIDVLMRIAIEINVARTARGITQQDLAEKAKTTQKIISKIESGDYKVGIDLLARITKSLGVFLSIGDSVISEQSVPQGVIRLMQSHNAENVKSVSFNGNQQTESISIR